jgi:neutral ceramidase
MADRKLGLAGVCVLVLCAFACSAKIKGTIAPPATKMGSGSFRAGAGVADLTPIPGIPMAGYSIGGKIARGTWVRLRARALYLEDGDGDALALVACDLDQIPNGLSDEVAKRLKGTAAKHLGRAQIVLGASHTHHGPGSYFSSRMYNSMASPRGGFDRELFDFLAARIARAIEEAHASRTPAILRTAPAPGSAGAPNDRLPCVFRNRSRPAFERNPRLEVNALRSANPLPAPCPARCPDPLACQSVHTQIDYFTVVDAAAPSHVIGVAVFLAAHATVLTMENELYSSDFFGVTSTLLETGSAGCLGGSPQPVVAVFNGAEGDVSPAWEQGKRDRLDVLEIAGDVAARVCAILPAAVDRPNADIDFQWAEVQPLTNRPVDDPFDQRGGWEQRTARAPMVGAPAIGGAEDGQTFLHEMGFVEGLRGPVRDDQGAKQPAEIRILGSRTSIAGLAALLEPPPKAAPIGVYRLGNLALATLPGEFTTLLGERIRGHVAKNLTPKIMPPPDRIVLLGLAGGHVSYMTTPEEYEAQHYEGAQNLYGAAVGPLVAAELGNLAQQLGSPKTAPAPRCYSYDAGNAVRWRVRDSAGPPYEVDEGLGDVVQDLVFRRPKSDFPTFCFRDAVPRLSKISPGGACQRVMPDVKIQTAGGAEVSVGGVPQNSTEGLDVVTVLTGAGKDKATKKDATEWCAIWMVPAVAPAGQYRFRIEPIFGPAFGSPAFQVGPMAPSFFERPNEPLVPDRRDSVLCDGAFDFLGLCPEPQPCKAP